MEAEFPILLSVLYDETVVHRLQPEDMDALGQEIALAFQRCAVPESQLSPFDREKTQAMMTIVCMIANGLSERSEKSTKEGALRMLFLKTIITSKNLQALFRMCDPSTRTGDVRCQAIGFLYLFSESTSPWHVQIPASGEEKTQACSFGNKLLTVMLNALTQKGFCNNPGTCECVSSVWFCVGNALGRLLETSSSEALAGMLELLDSYDWPVILQSDAIPKKSFGTVFFFDAMMFMSLHKWACRFLRDNPNNNAKAKTFLREKLGSCHDFFRRVLRRIITGEIYSHPASTRSFGRSRLDEIEPIAVFVEQFISCLVPLPLDRETKSLVRRARMALEETLRSCPVQLSQRQGIQNFLLTLDNYHCLNNISDEFRWELLYEQYLSARSVTTDNEKMKKFRKDRKKDVKVQNNLEDGEMCANCFVLEKTLLDESNQMEGLMKCNRCRQMKYCSRECQLEHWKKAHKKQCNMAEKAAASSAKKSKP